MRKILLLSFAFFTLTSLFAETSELIIQANVNLPKDTLVRNQLLSDLNNFLSQKEKPNSENTFVLKEELKSTSILLNEMKEIEKNKKLGDDNFYRGYLTNVFRTDKNSYEIQFNYAAVTFDAPAVRASFSLLAEKKDDHFYFHSPLKQNAIAWKSMKFGTITVYYKNKINSIKADSCFQQIGAFDKILNVPSNTTDFYCCDNLQEGLRLIGVDYKSDYNGKSYGAVNSDGDKMSLVVDGTLTSEFSVFDPHDLWHSRLHKVVSTSVINKPIDEGMAFLYGGSWGLTREEILSRFKTFVAENPNADWLALYNESKNFDVKAKYPLNVDYMINALLIKKLEKEKGFPALIEFLSCGKSTKENANYFAALEKISGITKSYFNASVLALIKSN